MKNESRIIKAKAIVRPDEKHTFRGRWIQNPIFFLKGYQERRPADRNAECATELKNVHTFYRHREQLPQNIRKATLRITADDSVRLYFNGNLVMTGPAQSLPCHYYYQIYDVTDILNSSGTLTICAWVYYFGQTAHSYISADNLEGLLLEIELETDDGNISRIISDASWKCKTVQSIHGEHLYGYTTQFSEDIDMNGYLPGWKDENFDDSDWDRVCVRGTPFPMHYTVLPQPTPPAELTKLSPAKTSVISPECTVFDFGKETVGTANLSLKGTKGQKIAVRYGEELNEDGSVKYRLRANCFYEDTVILSGNQDEIEFFDYKGFRYIEIYGPENVTDRMISVTAISYPFEKKASMKCSDSLMEKIWKICENGVHWGTQDTYVDCPTREKGGFTGDAYITAFSHLYLTGDARIFRKLLYDIAVSLRMDSNMTDVVPSYVTGGYADYTLLIPSLFERYYEQTGDAETVKELIYVIDALREIASGWENADGLIQAPRSPINPKVALMLIDWPPDLRGDFDYNGALQNGCSVLSLLYYGFLKEASTLYSLCGEQEAGSFCLEKATNLGNTITKLMYQPEQKLFSDHSGTDHCSLHSNAPALCFGLPLPEGSRKKAADFLYGRGLHCGVYFAYFVIRGLFISGEYEKAWDLITNRTEYSWYSMVKCGATSCMEVWAPDMKWNTSFCHPWSSSPITFWIEEICGLRPGLPGWKSVHIAPRIPAKLKSGSVTVPIPGFPSKKGRISLNFTRTDNICSFTVKMPENMQADFSLPESAKTFSLDGKQIKLKKNTDRGIPCKSVSETLSKGCHEFSFILN